MQVSHIDSFDVGNCNFCHRSRLFVWHLKAMRGIDVIICDACLDELKASTHPTIKDRAVQNNDATDNR